MEKIKEEKDTVSENCSTDYEPHRNIGMDGKSPIKEERDTVSENSSTDYEPLRNIGMDVKPPIKEEPDTVSENFSAYYDPHAEMIKDYREIEAIAKKHKEYEILLRRYPQYHRDNCSARMDYFMSLDPSISAVKYFFKEMKAENLRLKYAKIFNYGRANFIYRKLAEEIQYYDDSEGKVEIPRKQVAFGNRGLTYCYNGTNIPALPWSKSNTVKKLKEVVEEESGRTFNYVVINRYKNCLDHVKEHEDEEKNFPGAVPVSLLFGGSADFIFTHKDSRGKNRTRIIDPVKIELQNGFLLIMQRPTKKYWYLSPPVQKMAKEGTIHLTFHKVIKKK